MKKKLLCLLCVLTFFGNVALLSSCAPGENGHMHSLVHHVPLAATCETAGNAEYWSCAGCGKFFSDENAVNEIETAVIPAAGHSWSEWETVQPANCTQSGSESRSCTVCSQKETRTIDATSHDYSGGWKFDAQNHWQECKNCGEKKDVDTHSISDDSCAVCGYTITFTENLAYTLSDDETYYIVTGRGTATDSFVYIPAQINGKPVKGIAASAFELDAVLTEVYLPESIEYMENFAFYGCKNLKSVKMENGLKTIGNEAFKQCTALRQIEISSSLQSIGKQAFKYCNSLNNVYIRDLAAWCRIYFEPDNNEATSNPLHYAAALYLNNEQIINLCIPDGVTYIADYAFAEFKTVNTVEIGDQVKTIGSHAFSSCVYLRSVTIGNSVTSIGDEAFTTCIELNSVTLPNSLRTIGAHAFHSTALTNVTIPDGVTSIGEKAFTACHKLRTVTMTNSVTEIGDSAFSLCDAMRSITLSDNVTSIGESVFQNCSSLTEITLPAGVKSIGPYAFSGCSSLTSVTIPDNVIYINQSAFEYCSSLTSVTIPDSVTNIGNSVFLGCSLLKSVTIPDSVTKIGDSVFGYCSSLTSITIPDSVTEISYSAFKSCSSLKSVTIPDSVTRITYSAFEGCSALTEAYFENPNGWYSNGYVPAEQLKDPQKAANLLKTLSSSLRKS